MSTWCDHYSCKLIALKLHINCSYVFINWVAWVVYVYNFTYDATNSCDLFDNIHVHRNMLNCNELQMLIAAQKPNCTVSCKSPHFFICLCFSIPHFSIIFNFQHFQEWLWQIHFLLAMIILLTLLINFIFQKNLIKCFKI